MKVFLLLTCLQLVSSASLRAPSDVEADIAEEDRPVNSGPDRPPPVEKSQDVSEPDETADGTKKPVPAPTRGLKLHVKRPTKVYDAIHNRERRSAPAILPPDQVSLNCREVVAVGVKDPYTCARLAQDALPGDPSTYGVSTNAAGEVVGADGKVIFADPTGYFSSGAKLNLANAPGRCRFDPYKAQVDPSTACLCVATSTTCSQNRAGCCWFENKKSGKAECISNAEKFYDYLYMLLHKRGKKDFAINIRYGATPARGSLPLGPLGPQIIGQGNPSPTYSMNPDGTASPIPVDPSFGTSPYGMPPQPYGMPPQPYGMQPQSYGMPPQPYGMPPMPMDPSAAYGGLGFPMGGFGVPGYVMPGVLGYGAPNIPSYGMPNFSVPSASSYGAPSTSSYGAPSTPTSNAPSTPSYGAPNTPSFTAPNTRSFVPQLGH